MGRGAPAFELLSISSSEPRGPVSVTAEVWTLNSSQSSLDQSRSAPSSPAKVMRSECEVSLSGAGEEASTLLLCSQWTCFISQRIYCNKCPFPASKILLWDKETFIAQHGNRKGASGMTSIWFLRSPPNSHESILCYKHKIYILLSSQIYWDWLPFEKPIGMTDISSLRN